MPLSKYIDTLLQFAGSGDLEYEIVRAKKEYFARFGVSSNPDGIFENYMLNFVDWYVFDRPLTNTGKTPLWTFLDRFSNTLDEKELEIYRDMTRNIHSLFQVIKIGDEEVKIKELFDENKFIVKDEMPKGFCKNEIFEARIIPYGQDYCFGEAFMFHPLQAVKIILEKIKRIKTSYEPLERLKLIQDLASRKFKLEQYRHVDALKFYKD